MTGTEAQTLKTVFMRGWKTAVRGEDIPKHERKNLTFLTGHKAGYKAHRKAWLEANHYVDNYQDEY